MNQKLDAEDYNLKGYFEERPARLALIYARAIKLHPVESSQTNNLGFVLYQQLKYDSAIDKYKKAIILDSKSLNPYFNWSEALSKQGKTTKALEICELAALENPSCEALSHWGSVLETQGSYEEAIVKYKEVINLNPRKIQTYIRLGLILRKQEKYEEAIDQYKIALEIDPINIEAYNNWGVVLYHQHKYEDAIGMFIEVTNLDPSDTYAYLNWGFALHQQKKFTEAKEIYLRGIEPLRGRSGKKKELIEALNEEIENIEKKLRNVTFEDQIKHLNTTIEGMKQVAELLHE